MIRNNIKNILFENSIFSAVSSLQQILSTCSERCRNSIKNGPNYNYQVQCCTSNCKINIYTKIITALQNIKPNIENQAVVNKKLVYYTEQLQKEKIKYQKYRGELKRRQSKVPSNLSLKPSPERWDPKSLN
jgi:hypothetical protein